MEQEYHFNWEGSKAKIREKLKELHRIGKWAERVGLKTDFITEKKWELRKQLMRK